MKNMRLKFIKRGNMIYISHLDLMRFFQRTFRRAGIMLRHTEGFNPQPKMSFATALALGTSSDGEYMDVELDSDISSEALLEKLNENLSEDIKIVKVAEREGKESIMSLIEWGQYVVKVVPNSEYILEEVQKKLDSFLKLEEVIEHKEKKKKNKVTTREVNIRPNIKRVDLMTVENGEIMMNMFLKTGSNGNLKPEVVVAKLVEYADMDLDLESVKVHRVDLFVERDGKIVTPI
ncbi:hypothetical protein EUAN_10710 [Andreesenia angusta]|uniref:DUF2344 domain-containing protein n=1 Tax=Andreesenia angusta TaxID=39480 RepID=A0A1S1V8N9_9FIRM|nr:TIGR03936 family radical SAM-associated protein [Andreesenia angusta]OHW62507.1 hypothetical protein EUAN_10710 [Andreesenia angusta]